VSEFLGTANIFAGTVLGETEPGEWRVTFEPHGGEGLVRSEGALTAGQRVRIAVRPERMTIGQAGERSLVAKVQDAVRMPLQAANFCIQNNTCLDEAGRWIDASIAQQESFANLRAKAMLLAKKNDTKGAATYGEKALAAAKTAQQPPNPQQVKDLEGMVADWKKGK
jgi:ABC-type Fe3+/spermidine/putrescine transport system ATPase subunit